MTTNLNDMFGADAPQHEPSLNGAFVMTKEQLEAMAQEVRTYYVSFEPAGIEGGVYVRELNAKDRDRIVRQGRVTLGEDGSKTIDLSSMPVGTTVEIVARSVVNESGEFLFNPRNKSDLATINRLPNKVVDLIVTKVREVSGLDDEKKALDDAKND